MTSAYDSGVRARREGKALGENPYYTFDQKPTRERYENAIRWERGWHSWPIIKQHAEDQRQREKDAAQIEKEAKDV